MEEYNKVIEELKATIEIGWLYDTIIYITSDFKDDDDIYIYNYNGKVIITKTDVRELDEFSVDNVIEKELRNKKNDGISLISVADYNKINFYANSHEEHYIKKIKTAKHICNLLKTKKNLKNCFVKKFDKNTKNISSIIRRLTYFI